MRRYSSFFIFFFLACVSLAQVSINLIQPPPNQLKTNDLWNAILINSTKTILHITISGTLESRGDGIVIEGKSRIISLSPGTMRITYDDIKSGNINYRSSSWGEAYNRTGNAPTGDYTICISVKAEDGREIVSGCIDQTILTPVAADLKPRLNAKLLPLVPNKLTQSDLFKCIVTNLNPVPYDAAVITVELRENNTGLQAESKLNSVTIAGTKILSFNDFNTANLIYHNTKLKEAYSKNMNAPDGNYTICVYVKNEKGEVLESDCIDQTIITIKPEKVGLQLITPIDGSELFLNQPILFSWMSSSSKLQTSITYKMKVVEILGSQSPSEAILRNLSWFDKIDILTTTLIYPVAARKFDVNKQYAWQITAFLRNIEIGKSESWRFKLNNIELPQEIIEGKQFDGFKVEFKKTNRNDTISYELSPEFPNNCIELADNILNIQYSNNYSSIDDIILRIYDVEKYEFIEPRNKNKNKPIVSDKEIKQITSNGLNRITVDLKEYALQPKTTYLLTVSASKNNYYLKFKVTNDREK